MKNLNIDRDFLNVEYDFAYKHLTECLKEEVQKGQESFSWRKTIHRAIKCRDRRFYFWFRIWRYFYATNKFKLYSLAKRKAINLNREYNIDINPRSTIGPGLKIVHFTGIVIRGNCNIGKNVVIRQNVTIGDRHDNDIGLSYIGDNVEIGANSCIIGNINIGSNVTIGAMSLINKSIPDNCVVYSANQIVMREK
ncbi:Serine acetyltransferase [Enterobacter cloacae]|jgi:serine acetyltransferase|uniref:serine acetyltransferase n=1 Tax=Enterobacter TaxID=547 RepID=UPI00075144E8|nr:MULTISPECIES: serine acetyltransferase [Enterobacter]RTN96355.1 serine acetyltransferase [Enterobacter sp. WCHEn090032]CAF2440668.1 Serine acetyltransferase [Enterobacter cloacae]CAH5220557.1 Serine acetyltransferase [Enterobacter cloacae]